MVKWVLFAVAAIGGVGGVLYVIGAMLPREHVAEVTRIVRGEPARVFERIRDVGRRTEWRKGLTSVTMENDRFFTEQARSWKIRYEVMESLAPERLVTRIADDSLEFGGRWVIEVKPAEEGSSVTVREEGFVKSPLFRFFSRFVFGHTRTINEFLDDLERVQRA